MTLNFNKKLHGADIPRCGTEVARGALSPRGTSRNQGLGLVGPVDIHLDQSLAQVGPGTSRGFGKLVEPRADSTVAEHLIQMLALRLDQRRLLIFTHRTADSHRKLAAGSAPQHCHG